MLWGVVCVKIKWWAGVFVQFNTINTTQQRLRLDTEQYMTA